MGSHPHPRQWRAARQQDIAAMRAKLASALADPEHGEYQAIVKDVVRLAKLGNIPPREIPLLFMMTLLARRRFAQGMEAGTGETRSGSTAEGGDSPVANGDAPNPSLSHPKTQEG